MSIFFLRKGTPSFLILFLVHIKLVFDSCWGFRCWRTCRCSPFLQTTLMCIHSFCVLSVHSGGDSLDPHHSWLLVSERLHKGNTGPRYFWDWAATERRQSLLPNRLFNSSSLEWITDVLKCCELAVEQDINKVGCTGWVVSGLEEMHGRVRITKVKSSQSSGGQK